uniref:GH18 domain-containing protein n=1 Tax=Parascaris univalens TaxID=6257 RepID=A0A914ZRQ1_PARUN
MMNWVLLFTVFCQMSHNRTARARFISSVIEFVHEHDFDGIDIDWEYPKGCDDILNYALLFKELRERFDEEFFSGRRNRLLLTAAVSANKETIQSAYNISEISKYVDFILLMSYDFHGAWETETDIHNALYGRQNETAEHQMLNIDWAANYWANQGMPREKIVIGIATYGRGWTLRRSQGNGIGSLGTASRATKFIGESGVAAYYEICEMLAEGAERRWESENQVPYLVYDDQWFTYDDPESVKRKMAWLKEQRFGGAFVWTLDFDDFNGRCGSSSEGAYPLVGMVAHELAAMDLSKVKDTMDSQP